MHIGNNYGNCDIDCMEKPGERIRRMRKVRKWNQVDLAESVSVDQSTISDIERGASFTADLLMRLADKFEVSPTLLMRGQDAATWPFPRIAIESFLALNAEDRAYIEGKLEAEIARLTPGQPSDDEALFRESHGRRPAKATQRKRAA